LSARSLPPAAFDLLFFGLAVSYSPDSSSLCDRFAPLEEADEVEPSGVVVAKGLDGEVREGV
jgi:hypothetical protein